MWLLRWKDRARACRCYAKALNIVYRGHAEAGAPDDDPLPNSPGLSYAAQPGTPFRPEARSRYRRSAALAEPTKEKQ